MWDRIILKIRETIHYIFHFRLYHGKVILRGVPRILYGKNIEFGNNVRLNENVFLHGKAGIKIGDNTTISYGAMVITESYDITSIKTYLERQHKGKKITIGNNVWIGANAIILPGVKIEDNIIVGAGSVVTKSLEEQDSIYAGNPAKFIRRIEK